ncbi:hypothetical protein JVU11DRAFT_12859 [Chiua virens]|nr:hypothetical protein JVU11DRAFT_12859 [Chiua virens]
MCYPFIVTSSHACYPQQHSGTAVNGEDLPINECPAICRFRFKGLYTFLTYAQVGELEREQVIACFEELGAEDFMIGKECHQDGGIHYHALVHWKEHFRLRDTTIFDLVVDGQRYHPNIRTIRTGHGNLFHVFTYVRKEGDFEGDLVIEEQGRGAGGADKEVWVNTMAAPTKEEFIQTLKDGAPNDIIKSWTNVAAFAEYQYGQKAIVPYESPFEFDGDLIPEALRNWATVERLAEHRPK